MARPGEPLPEGTDTIITGAGVDDSDRDALGGSPSAGDIALGSGSTAPQTLDTFEEPAGGEGGGGIGGGPGVGGGAGVGAVGAEAKRVIGERATGLRDQAADKVRAFAVQGKDRATSALDDVVRMVDDAAATIDERVGPQYGDYARRASQAVAGIATTLRDKDVDELFDDAREVVRKSPALAIGAATAVGFLIARLAKASTPPAGSESTGGEPGAGTGGTGGSSTGGAGAARTSGSGSAPAA